MSIETLVYQRWNSASLNTGIAKLYPGPENEDDSEAAPEGATLPRAEYVVGLDIQETITRLARILNQPITFRVWQKSWSTLGANLESIYDNFVEAEQATTNPLYMGEAEDGFIMGVEYLGRKRVPKKQGVYVGHLIVMIRWAKGINIPA